MDRYRDRAHAGSVLVAELREHGGGGGIVLGIPRGGVAVAAPLAVGLGLDLDVVVARKVGAPGNPELAIGAVAGTGSPILDRDLIEQLRVSEDWLAAEVDRQVAEVGRREAAYRQGRPAPDLAGRVVMVVDDGVATGATLRAALGSVAEQGPDRVVCVVPVGPRSTVTSLAAEVDEVICPLQPRRFRAVGEWYLDFTQTSDAGVRSLLGR